MSGRGKGGKAKGKAKSRSSRAGLQFQLSGEFIVFCVRETMEKESELVLPSTSLQ